MNCLIISETKSKSAQKSYFNVKYLTIYQYEKIYLKFKQISLV